MKKAIIPITISVIALALILIFTNSSSTPIEYIIDIELSEERRQEIEVRLAETEAEIAEHEVNNEEVPLRLYRYQAEDYRLLGKLSKAEQIYRDYLQKNPLDKVVQNNLGHLLIQMERYNEAEAVFRNILTNLDSDENDLRNYIRTLQLIDINDSRIIRSLENGIQLYGQTPYLMQGLADWYERQGECQLAIDHLKIIPQLDPEFSEQIEMDIQNLQNRCQN